MTKQAQTRLWFGPVLLLVSAFVWFGSREYFAWASAPAPTVTWGCGAANVMPAGVHLPEKAAFNWWLLAAQMLLAILVVVLAGLIWFALQLVAQINLRSYLKPLEPRFAAQIFVESRSLVSKFLLTNFGMRAPPRVVFV